VPNLTAFSNGRQSDYFELYRHNVTAIKSIDAALRVGVPATVMNAWIVDLIGFCAKYQIPSDFISNRRYPTDAFGKPGDDTETQLANRRSVMPDQTRDARREAGDRPLVVRNGAVPLTRAIRSMTSHMRPAFLSKRS
jgi:xylan 1,4-beta-xylosidase